MQGWGVAISLCGDYRTQSLFESAKTGRPMCDKATNADSIYGVASPGTAPISSGVLVKQASRMRLTQIAF